MAKVYSLKDYVNKLSDKIVDKFVNGEYFEVLDVIDTLESVVGENYDIALYRARAYYELGRHSLATREWFKCIAYTKDDCLTTEYNGLGANFYKMGEYGVAGYYFKLQIVGKKKVCYYPQDTKEYYEEVVFSKDNYYIAYPYDIADFTKTIEQAERLMKNGNFEGAIEKLQVIPENSKFYPTALVVTSIAKFFTGDTNGAVSDVEKSIEIQPTIASVCNAISIFTSVGNKEKADYYVEKLTQVKSLNGDDDNKIAMVYCERGEDELAEIYAKNYLSKNPYDTVILGLYGMIKYNLKDFGGAKRLFKKAYKISKNYIDKYYLNLCDTKSTHRLQYILDIPDEERQKIFKEIGKLIRAENSFRLENQDRIYEFSSYAFSTENYQLQSSIVTLLGELSTEKSFELMKKALLYPNVFDRIKSGVIGFLVADNFGGELNVVFSNVFKKITVYKAEFDHNNTIFTEAYAYLYAKLSHLEDNMEALKVSVENIYKALDDKDLLREVTDVKSLSAVIYELSSIADIKSRREFASFFEANLREIKRIKSLL